MLKICFHSLEFVCSFQTTMLNSVGAQAMDLTGGAVGAVGAAIGHRDGGFYPNVTGTWFCISNHESKAKGSPGDWRAWGPAVQPGEMNCELCGAELPPVGNDRQ